MTTLSYSDTILNVLISKGEKITLVKAKRMIRKGGRIIQQNRATSVIVQFDVASRIDEDALAFFNRVLCYNSSFPVAIINS